MWDKPNCPSASESSLPTRERFGAVERGSPIANPRAGNDVPQKLCGIGPPVRGRRPRRPAGMDGTYVGFARSGAGGTPRGLGPRAAGWEPLEAGGGRHPAVPAVAVGAVAHRTIGARHLAH